MLILQKLRLDTTSLGLGNILYTIHMWSNHYLYTQHLEVEGRSPPFKFSCQNAGNICRGKGVDGR